MAQLFELGVLLITARAEDELDPADVFDGFLRHAKGDWGELDEEDRQENKLSLTMGFRILSAYTARNGRPVLRDGFAAG